MLPKAHLTVHSQMSGSRWVTTPSWVIKTFLYSSSVYSCHLFLISSASVTSLPFLFLYCAHLCMKCSLGISNFIEKISSLSHSLFSSICLHCSLKKAFLSLLVILWYSTFRWIYLSLSPLPFCFSSFLSYLLGLLRWPLCLLTFLFLGDGFGHHLLYNVTNLCP